MSFFYKPKAFHDDDGGSEEDCSDAFDNTVGKRKRKEVDTKKKVVAKKTVKISATIDVDDSENGFAIDDSISEQRKLDARSIVSRLLSESKPDDQNLDDSQCEEFENEEVKRKKELLSLFKQSNLESLTTDDTQEVSLIPAISTFVVKTVKQASERVFNHAPADILLFALNSPEKPKAPIVPEVIEGSFVRIKTRLNGVHEKKFQILETDNLGKLRQELSRIYGVDFSKIKMESEYPITDDQTPEELEMADEDIIDVTIPKDLYAAAIVNFEKVGQMKPKAGEDKSQQSQLQKPSASMPARTVPVAVIAKPENAVEERVKINIIVPPQYTTTSGKCEFDFTVFVSQTLRSLHDILSKQSSVRFPDDVCYTFDPAGRDDLNLDLSFKQQKVITDSTLTLRSSPITITITFEQPMSTSSTSSDFENMTVKLRLEGFFGKLVLNIAKSVGKRENELQFFYDGRKLTDAKKLTLHQLGIKDDSVISVIIN